MNTEQRKSKKTKKLSEGYLERAALHYLGRYGSSKANLIAVLQRKALRRLESGGGELTPEQVGWVTAVADKCERLGYVNDAQYAEQKWHAMLRRGTAPGRARMALRERGISAEIIDQLAGDDEGLDSEFQAALNYARRRRFGPFARPDKPKERDKVIAAFARAGFSFSVVERVLNHREDEH